MFGPQGVSEIQKTADRGVPRNFSPATFHQPSADVSLRFLFKTFFFFSLQLPEFSPFPLISVEKILKVNLRFFILEILD